MKGIDTLKFLFSLVVVWIHTGVGNLGGLTPWAVPFFFLISGFFLFGKLFGEPDRAKQGGIVCSWSRKVLRLYLLWSLIFLPFAIIGLAQDHLGLAKSVAVYLRNILLVGENYLSWPLWYLLGMLWAGLIIWIAGKLKLPFWVLCVLAVVLYATPYLLHLDSNELYLKCFKTTRNGFFIGFPFMVLGGLIQRFLPPMKNWEPGSWQQKTALNFRFLSTHIYLSHMIWGGLDDPYLGIRTQPRVLGHYLRRLHPYRSADPALRPAGAILIRKNLSSIAYEKHCRPDDLL